MNRDKALALAFVLLLAPCWGFETTPCFGQHLPVFPSGARAPMAQPIAGMQPALLGIPVRTESPFARRPLDQAQVNRIDGQLAALLTSVRPELGEISKGHLPANLISNLKRMEKLSKQLRRQLSP